MKTSKWNKGKTEMPKYSILEAVIENEPNFDKLPLLSQKIEKNLVIVSDDLINAIKKLNPELKK